MTTVKLSDLVAEVLVKKHGWGRVEALAAASRAAKFTLNGYPDSFPEAMADCLHKARTAKPGLTVTSRVTNKRTGEVQ